MAVRRMSDASQSCSWRDRRRPSFVELMHELRVKSGERPEAGRGRPSVRRPVMDSASRKNLLGAGRGLVDPQAVVSGDYIYAMIVWTRRAPCLASPDHSSIIILRGKSSDVASHRPVSSSDEFRSRSRPST